MKTRDLDQKKIDQRANKIAPFLRATPVMEWDGPVKKKFFPGQDIFLKLEFLQHSGSFKARGAFSVILGNQAQAKQKGVLAVSRGNHACAVSYAARELGIHAKVVIPRDASVRRIEKCKSYGAEIVFSDSVKDAFVKGEAICRDEGRLLIHPYEGEGTALGTASLGREFLTQVPDLQVVYVACGGGGLLAGVSATIKQVAPKCQVIGVEPQGAASMKEALQTGEVVSLSQVETIADSLAAPGTLPYSQGLCQKYVDDVVTVSDGEILASLEDIRSDLTIVMEPSGAAALAGAIKHNSPLQKQGVILCGANIELEEYRQLLGLLGREQKSD